MKRAFSFLLLFSLFTLCGAERIIVQNGKSEYVICHGSATAVPRRAAADLQTYIQKATGAKLPIVNISKRGNKPAFLIGFEKVDTPEGFIVKTSGRDIIISGNDTKGQVENAHWATGARTGTWYGVCDFLENQLGIRWFMPGPLGEYVPKRKTWSVPDLNYADHPEMEKRDMGYVSGGPNAKKEGEPDLFKRRNRCGKANSWKASHSWLHNLPGKKYFKDHPDWFAYVGGRRYSLDSQGHGLQICTTNPAALDELAKNLIASTKQWKVPVMLSLSPNDGGHLCECDKCTALDDGFTPTGRKILTTRMVTYANEVAKRVNKVLPDQTFGLYAYSYYVQGVSKVKVDPHVTIMEVDNDTGISYYNPAHRESHLKNLLAWRKQLSKLFFYSTPEGMGNLELPCYHFENICMLFDNLYKANVTGIAMNNGTSFGSSGLNNYFYARFAWRAPKDPGKFYETTLKECYGEIAAPVMKGYFADVESRMAKFSLRQLSEDVDLGYVRRLPGVLKNTYRGLAEKWLEPIRKVAEQTKDKGQKARIMIALNNLEYCQATLALYDAALKVVGRPSPKKEDVIAANKLLQKRAETIKKMAVSPSNTTPARITKQERHHNIPFDPQIFSYLLAAQNRKTTYVNRLTGTPLMDGKVDDKIWQNLPVCRIELAKDDAAKFKNGADVKLFTSGNDLYIGIRCEEPLMEKVTDSAKGPNAAVWNENSLDFFIQPAGTQDCYQVVFNAIGSLRTLLHDKGKPVDVRDIAAVKTFKGKDFWSAEVRISLSAIAKNKEFRGDVWAMNFCRTRRTCSPSEYSCWSPTFGNFRQPARFGRVVFK